MTTRLDSFATAITRLSEALSAPVTDLTRDASIQRFEFCFELAWKVIQERARAEGLDCQSPKGCLKMAYKNSWITDETGWLAMLEDRNRTAHTYDETLAKDVYRRLPAHLPLLQVLNTYLRSTQA
ncbi:MAG: nucleotidyltransferase substrate binding protein [Nitrospira sp.]|nr:nucleotidyltransferase substrate binding protein [Nitrospira sp.]